MDDELARFVNPKHVFGLLNGRSPASDPQGEAYRLLLVGICNSYSEVMPFMFEKIEDYTELLMPLDLLSENSVLHDLREALSPEACEDVEVIGWLYQYYISERKDKVFEALKQNQKIRGGGYSCGDAVVHAALDRVLSGGEFARAAVDAQSSELWSAGEDGVLHRARAGGVGLFANREPGGVASAGSRLRFGTYPDVCL